MYQNSQYTDNKLRVAHWNANGLKSNIREVADFLERQNVDILLVNETKLKEKIKCKIPGFQCFRKDRPGNVYAGGVAIYCKNNIPCTEIDLNTTSVEAHAIKLRNNLIIATVYARPQTKINVNDLSTIFNTANSVLVVGDFNAKHNNWHCANNNQNGKIIFNYTSFSNTTVLAPDNFTLYPYSQALPSVVDFALIKNIQNIRIETLNELDSDHLPVIVTINNNPFDKSDKKMLHYKKADWGKFSRTLNDIVTIDSH